MSSDLPAVVAVIVVSDFQDWLESTLNSLASQDVEGLSFLVLDSSTGGVEDIVMGILPGAHYKRIPQQGGYGNKANEVINLVKGATHYLFCHDDISPESDATRQLLVEAYKSNAGVVGPKYVNWDDPSILLSVGLGTDRAAVVVPRTEPNERDQGQHDGSREVAAVPGGFMLVRADLFEQLGGFDDEITYFGEDIDFCWRARLAGSHVYVAPGAKVLHRLALSSGCREMPKEKSKKNSDTLIAPSGFLLLRRSEIRLVIKSYSPWRLFTTLSGLVILSILEVIGATFGGKRTRAIEVVKAWSWNISKHKSLFEARKKTQHIRKIKDREFTKLESSGSERLARVLSASRVAQMATQFNSLLSISMVFLLLVLIIGGRNIFTGFESTGQFGAMVSPSEMWHSYFSGYYPEGLGSQYPQSPYMLFLSIGGFIFGGSTSLVRTLVVFALPLAGLVAIAKLCSYFFGLTANREKNAFRVALILSVLGFPFLWNDFSKNSISGLAAFFTFSWLLYFMTKFLEFMSSETKLSRNAPFKKLTGGVIVVAIGSSICPSLLLLIPMISIPLAIWIAFRFSLQSGLRSLCYLLSTTIGALILLLPWSFEVIRAIDNGSLVGGNKVFVGKLSLIDIVTFGPSQVGVKWMTFVAVLASVLPIFVARRKRLVVLEIGWIIVASMWLIGLMQNQGIFGGALADPTVIGSIALTGFCLIVASSALAFLKDLPSHRLGWRQILLVFCVGVLIAMMGPLLYASRNGSFNNKNIYYSTWLPPSVLSPSPGGSRVLWLGAPSNLPGAPVVIHNELALSVTSDGIGTIEDSQPLLSSSALAPYVVAVSSLLNGLSTQMGSVLSSLGIRWIVITDSRSSLSGTLANNLGMQSDLLSIPTVGSIRVFEAPQANPIRQVVKIESSRGSPSSVIYVGPIPGSDPMGPFSFKNVTGNIALEATSGNWKVNGSSSRYVIPGQNGALTEVFFLKGSKGEVALSPTWLSELGGIYSAIIWFIICIVAIIWRPSNSAKGDL
ncbi:MAG: glycosyltransferase [Acidimicrobiales bacterium]|nr:glycosyltransferase [Acidimicrobiales bacterium]